MNKLKAVGAGAGALAMIWAGASYYLGGKVEEVFTAQMELMTSGPFASATVSRTERRWFSSEIELILKFGLEQDNSEETSKTSTSAFLIMGPATFAYKISHGPIIFGPNGLELAVASIDHRLKIAEYLEALNIPDLNRNIIAAIPPDYDFHTWMKFGFDGTLYTEFNAAPLKIPLESGGSSSVFQWGGIAGTADYNSETKRYTGKGVIPTMGFHFGNDDKEADIRFDRFRMDMDIILERPMLWLGDITVAFDKIAVNATSGKNENGFSMNGLTIKSTATSPQPEALINSTVEFRFDALTGLEKLTKGLAIGPIEWIMEFNNLPPDAFEKYFEFTLPINAEDNPQVVARLLAKAVKGFLIADPEFNITKGIINYGGGTASYTHKLAAKTVEHYPENSEEWYAATKYVGRLAVDDVFARTVARQMLADQLGAKMDSLTEEEIEAGISNTIWQTTASGLVTKEGDQYQIDLAITDGILSISGKPILDIRTQLGGAN